MKTKNIQDVVAEKVEEFERLFRVSTPYRTTKEQKQAEWLQATLTQLVKEVEAGERERCVEAVSNSRTLGENLGVSVECENARWQAIWDIKKPTTPPTSDEALQDNK